MNSFGGLQMVDETGLDGIYTWVRDLPPPTAGMSFQEATQGSFKAMIEAAGLKLETRKAGDDRRGPLGKEADGELTQPLRCMLCRVLI